MGEIRLIAKDCSHRTSLSPPQEGEDVASSVAGSRDSLGAGDTHQGLGALHSGAGGCGSARDHADPCSFRCRRCRQAVRPSECRAPGTAELRRLVQNGSASPRTRRSRRGSAGPAGLCAAGARSPLKAPCRLHPKNPEVILLFQQLNATSQLGESDCEAKTGGRTFNNTTFQREYILPAF
ncbi:hypothetical protein R6Z07F_009653 [Ovis aries]